MPPLIELIDIARHYRMGDQQIAALDGVRFTIDRGELVAIVGSSGSGKSTLLNVLGCLDTPTRGRYPLDGQGIQDLGDDERARLRNRQIGFVLQSFQLLHRATAQEIAASRHADEVDLQDQIDARDAARRRIAELEVSRAQLTLTAPRTGTVVYGSGGGGDSRSIGDQFWQQDVIVQVVALDAMTGDGMVDEIDIGPVAVGQPVTLRLDALPDLTVHGSEASVATSVVASSDADPSKLVQLQIAIAPAAGAGLRPGMRFRGEIEVQRIAGAIQVPAEAVFIDPDGPVAYRDTAHGLERVALRLGRRTADAIEVEAGLAAGDRVQRVWNQVRAALRDQRAAALRVIQASKSRTLAGLSLEIENRKYASGTSPNLGNLAIAKAQNDFASAELIELGALLTRAQAATSLLLATGQLLDKRHVKVQVAEER